MADAVKYNHGISFPCFCLQYHYFFRQGHFYLTGSLCPVYNSFQRFFRTTDFHVQLLLFLTGKHAQKIGKTSSGVSTELSAHHLHPESALVCPFYKSHLLSL